MIGVILNPVAGGGRIQRDWAELAAALEERIGPFELARTSREGHANLLARQFVERGADLVIAVGGDGTTGEVVDGLLQASMAGRKTPQLGILPFGTGADFARTLDLGATPLDALDKLGSRRTRVIDAGRVSYVADNGEAAVRCFLNIASFGLSGPTARAVNRIKQSGKPQGKLVYLYHTLSELLRYRMKDVRITLDGADPIDARIAVVAIANGRFFGGAMMVAPDALVDDGLFDVVVFRGGGKLQMISDMNLIYSGAHRNHKLVTIKRARSIEVEPLGDRARNAALLEIDGESAGRIPARFDILPAALTLRA